ncbi:TonB-dependent receptor [Pedobacter sp. HMF7647]|uniref:TonB-dependent receptor n=1 Tax=Hufsiella arboris TaxID=2695275 RepID=A0A7K1Y620_9SPHI|nr:TonB-dependent receptor [Hufsiella arboris]MXV49468.1 TonB-dependent receptor [Hufsiella arboris]
MKSLSRALALAAILTVLFSVKLFSQTAGTGTVSGKLVDETGKAIDFASVALVKKSDNQTLRSTQTDPQGNFKIANVPFADYILKISFVGYQPYANNAITVSAQNTDIALGSVKMTTGKTNVLKEVVVQGQKNAMQIGIDKKIFNVDQSLVSQGGSATDLLTNVPTVAVDIDGNVSLRGTSNVKILIDGKPSALAGGNIADVLQSLPASSIESIELITNPSSKYQADGQSGIINIVLKKNQKVGLNGMVSGGAGNLDNYNASTNLSYRDKKINLYGNYSYRNGYQKGSGFTNTTTYEGQTSLVNNNSISSGKNIGNNLKLGLDYYLSQRATLGISGNANFRNGDRDEDLNYFYDDLSRYTTSIRNSDRNSKDKTYDWSLDYTQKFKKKGEELTANFSYGKGNDNDLQNFNQTYQGDASKRDSLTSNRQTDTEAGKNYNIQVDYTLPVNDKVKWEAGYRSTIRNEFDTQLFETNQDGIYNIEYDQTNDFKLEDIVHALYTNYQNQFTKTFGMQIGLRAEQAYLNTEYIGKNPLEPKNSQSNLDYFRVYPSIFFTKKFGGEQQLQLSYTRRVNRPQGWMVNPFLDRTDPSNFRAGNPSLKPEDIHSFELGYSKFWDAVNFTSSVYYRQVNDVIQPVRSILPTNNLITLTNFYNLTSSNAIGLELISKADINKAISLTGNVNLFYNRLEGNEQYNLQSSDGYNWNANLIGNFKLPKNISAQFNMNYSAPRNTAQGTMKEMFGTDAGIRYDFLKNRAGSLSFNMRDIFNTRRFGQTTETPELIQDFERRRQGQMGMLTFSYRFGKSDFNNQQRKKRDQDQQQQSSPEDYGGGGK